MYMDDGYNKNDLISKINRLKEDRNAVIVAHSYQNDDIQEIADIVGDSYALSKYCSQTDKDVIVFCGVHFMAESAKILSPDKTVLLPEKLAGCPMADMVTAEALREEKKKYPNAVTVCYINSSAEVKAECDVCCTSSNAVNIIRKINEKDILFVPDMNLSRYVQKQCPEKNIILWNGYCPTHNKIKPEDVLKVRELHPDALFLVHPECTPEVCELADYVGSTKQIIDYAGTSDSKKFIIGTEMGVMYALRKNNPDKEFFLLSPGMICPNMKKTSLESVYKALSENIYEINLDKDIIDRASKSLDKMLELAK